MHFSHLKEHIPWREKTKKDNKQKERREGRERGKKDSHIKSFKLCESNTHRAKRETMQLRKTDERQVYGVEGRGRGKGQNETKQTKLKTVTKIKSALEKYALMNGK